jgi:hypothetical protein
MAKQATCRLSIVKRHNDQQTEKGRETLKEMFRVHFSDSNLIDDSYDNGEGQQNLGICESITNRGDWNLARSVINQSKIRLALGTFKPFKYGRTEEIVPVLLQQGAEHIVPQLYRIYTACMAFEFIPIAWKQDKVMLSQSLENSTIPRIRLIFLSASLLFF